MMQPMMEARGPSPFTPRFVYSANASAVSAVARRIDNRDLPEPVVLPVRAPSVLPCDGGEHEARLGPENFHDVVAFEDAVTSTKGEHSGTERRTTSFASLRNVTIAKRLTIEYLSVRLTSIDVDGDYEPDIVLADCDILGAKLDGTPINIQMAGDAFSGPFAKLSKLRQAYEEDASYYDRYSHMFFAVDPNSIGNKLPVIRGKVFCTLVERIQCDHPDVSVNGNEITVKDFGRVRFADMILSDAKRQVVLLRARLGSPIEAEMDAAAVETNGTGYP